MWNTISTECCRCPRLVEFRAANREREPRWWNAPVPSWGSREAGLLIVGLAPGLKGANRTGRPFTGDASGDLLLPALEKAGFLDASGMRDAVIINACACVPPANHPLASELANCRPHLEAQIRAMQNLRAVLALGRVAHEAVAAVFGGTARSLPFEHGRCHELRDAVLFDSYHPSRYNVNTGRITAAMLDAVLENVAACLRSAR